DGTPYHVTAYATDGTNQSTVGASEAITFDRVAPAAPVIAGPVEDDDIVNAAEADDGVTIGGTAEAGGTVQGSWGGTTLTPIAVNADGSWSAIFAPGEVPADGTHAISAVAFDAAGNEGAPGERPVAVDRDRPDLAITNNAAGSTNSPVTFTFTFNQP